jgi:hypothetical protein
VIFLPKLIYVLHERVLGRILRDYALRNKYGFQGAFAGKAVQVIWRPQPVVSCRYDLVCYCSIPQRLGVMKHSDRRLRKASGMGRSHIEAIYHRSGLLLLPIAV